MMRFEESTDAQTGAHRFMLEFSAADLQTVEFPPSVLDTQNASSDESRTVIHFVQQLRASPLVSDRLALLSLYALAIEAQTAAAIRSKIHLN